MSNGWTIQLRLQGGALTIVEVDKWGARAQYLTVTYPDNSDSITYTGAELLMWSVRACQDGEKLIQKRDGRCIIPTNVLITHSSGFALFVAVLRALGVFHHASITKHGPVYQNADGARTIEMLLKEILIPGSLVSVR